MTPTLAEAALARKPQPTDRRVPPLSASSVNLALALVRHTARLRADLEAEQADHQRDVEALRTALHASVDALYRMREERDRYRDAAQRERDENRRLRERLLAREQVAA